MSLGPSVSMLRSIVVWMMVVVIPASFVSAESNGAMLYGKGTVWVNGSPLPHSSAIFSGDLVQTKAESVANINASGLSVIVRPDSLVKFEDSAVSLEHGSLSVATSKGMVTRVLAVTVTPVSSAWTEFEVTDVSGAVQIVARKGDVNVTCGKDTARLAEGQQAIRDESGNCRRKKGGAYPPAGGDILANRYVLGGTAGGGGLLCLLLCDNDAEQPASQWTP